MSPFAFVYVSSVSLLFTCCYTVGICLAAFDLDTTDLTFLSFFLNVSYHLALYIISICPCKFAFIGQATIYCFVLIYLTFQAHIMV